MITETEFAPVRTAGWQAGLGPLLRRELGAWWSTGRWWRHALVWLALINGGIPLIHTIDRQLAGAQTDAQLQLVNFFFLMGGAVAAVGAIISGQDAIVGERQSGTAAWVLSKPASRTAFLLAKFLGQAGSLIVLTVLLQAPLAFYQVGHWSGASLRVLPFLAGTGLMVLNLLLVISLTLMLGAVSRSRTTVLSIALAWVFGGPFLLNLYPDLIYVLPVKLLDVGAVVAMGMGLPGFGRSETVAAVLLILVFLSLAIWRFQRDEV